MKCQNRFLIIEYDVLEMTQLSLSERVVYAYIVSYYRAERDGTFNRSNRFIATELGLTVRTVNRAINSLEHYNMIKCLYAKSKGVHSNRIIELVNDKKPDTNIVELFNYVYGKIRG